MKKKRNIFIWGISLTLMLSGCSALPSVSESDIAIDIETERASEYIAIGSHLTAPNTDSRLTLSDKKDALSADGLYYAAWTAGTSEAYENSDGETVDLYDAQLYLLLGEAKTQETAKETTENWLSAGQTSYDVTAEETIVCNGQTYTLLSYRFPNGENPYSRGVSAFGVFENCSVCVELACQEEYDENLEEILTTFLEGCRYE